MLLRHALTAVAVDVTRGGVSRSNVVVIPGNDLTLISTVDHHDSLPADHVELVSALPLWAVARVVSGVWSGLAVTVGSAPRGTGAHILTATKRIWNNLCNSSAVLAPLHGSLGDEIEAALTPAGIFTVFDLPISPGPTMSNVCKPVIQGRCPGVCDHRVKRG
jgi:hypothetical protein